jgi:predicted  nucleic acid-binding Zn-ribbon protein
MEVEEFETVTTQERKEELKMNLHLRKLAKYHKKVISELESDNQRLMHQLEEYQSRQMKWESEKEALRMEREALRKEREMLVSKIDELEAEIDRDE